jgi:hypothetical protein
MISDYSAIFAEHTTMRAVFTAAAAVKTAEEALAFTNAYMASQQSIMRIKVSENDLRRIALKAIFKTAWRYYEGEGTLSETQRKLHIFDIYKKGNEGFPDSIPSATEE